MRILGSLLLLASWPAVAALNIFACTPEWGALAKELGGDKASVYTATTALQDPHRVEARPSLLARARNADLMVCTGAELEIGWAPLVQTQSGNPKIQNGRPGYFEASSAVRLIERPARVDRSLGDVHSMGNPHLHLDPRNVARVAEALGDQRGPERKHGRTVDAEGGSRVGHRGAMWILPKPSTFESPASPIRYRSRNIGTVSRRSAAPYG